MKIYKAVYHYTWYCEHVYTTIWSYFISLIQFVSFILLYCYNRVYTCKIYSLLQFAQFPQTFMSSNMNENSNHLKPHVWSAIPHYVITDQVLLFPMFISSLAVDALSTLINLTYVQLIHFVSWIFLINKTNVSSAISKYNGMMRNCNFDVVNSLIIITLTVAIMKYESLSKWCISDRLTA